MEQAGLKDGRLPKLAYLLGGLDFRVHFLINGPDRKATKTFRVSPLSAFSKR